MAASSVGNFISDADMAKLQPDDSFISDADMAKMQGDEQEFSSPLEQVKAGAEGLARGASFGLSDLAETKLGISDPERVKKRKEYNPITSTVGEIAGNVGSALLAPELAPAALLERGAINVAERATAGIASSTAKKIATKALADATQGAAYGAGNLLTEKALGDPNLTAEQVMGTIGIGTLLGGTMGAGITAGGIAAKKTLNAAQIPDALEKHFGGAYSRVAGYLSDKDPQAIQDLFTNRLKATISDDERQTVQNEIVQQVISQDKALTDFTKATVAARPSQMGSLLNSQYGTSITSEQLDAMDAMRNSIDLTIRKMRDEPEIYSKTGTIKKLELIAKGLDDSIEGFNKRPDNMYGYMNKLKQKMDELSRFEGVIPDSERDTVREVRRLRGELKQTLEDTTLWGIAGERQASYNKATNQFLTAQKKFYKQFAVKTTDDAGNVVYDIDANKLDVYLYRLGQSKNARKEKVLADYMAKSNRYLDQAKQVHADLNVNPATLNVPDMALPQGPMETIEANNLLRRLKSPYRGTGIRENLVGPQTLMNVGGAAMMGHPGVAAAAGVFSALSNPVSMIEKIAAVEHAKTKAVKTFNTFIDRMLAGKSADMGTILAVDLAGRQHLLKDKESKDSAADVFKGRVNEVNELAGNPELLNNRLAQTTNGLQGIDKVQGQLTQKLATGVNYLSTTAPKNPDANSLVKKTWQPKPSDVMRWNRRLAAIQNPYSVLENPTTEGIDAIKTVYPEIYKAMGQQVVERISNRPQHEVPYKARLKLSRIFGLELDRSNPNDLARLQANYQQQQPQNVKRSSKQMQESKQSQTGTEKIEENLT